MAIWSLTGSVFCLTAQADDCIDAVHDVDALALKFHNIAENINNVVDAKLDNDVFITLHEYARKAARDSKLSENEEDVLWSMAKKAQLTNTRKAVEREIKKLKGVEKELIKALKVVKKKCTN